MNRDDLVEYLGTRHLNHDTVVLCMRAVLECQDIGQAASIFAAASIAEMFRIDFDAMRAEIREIEAQ